MSETKTDAFRQENCEKKIYDLKNLIGIAVSLSSNLNFDELVESILYSCIGQIFIEKIAILLPKDIDSNDFNIHMSKGYNEEVASPDIILNENSPLIKYFNASPFPIETSFLKKIPELKTEIKKIIHLNPKLIVPMKSKNTINGVLLLGEKMIAEKFSHEEKDFLKQLSNFAAIAVENSRLYRMATLDRMTRLYIHHYFQERLHEEMKRSSRNNSPLSLIMTDIDHFKDFNDTYGHQQGDIVLKEVANILMKQARTTDKAARYGGEEFVIILPDTDLDGAIIYIPLHNLHCTYIYPINI